MLAFLILPAARTHVIHIGMSCRQRGACWRRLAEEVRLVLASQNDGTEAGKAERTRFKWSSQFPWWWRLTGALSGVGETYNACLPAAPREPTHEKWKLFAPLLREVEWSKPVLGWMLMRGAFSRQKGWQHVSPGICNSLIHKLCSLWLFYRTIHYSLLDSLNICYVCFWIGLYLHLQKCHSSCLIL